MLKEYRLRPQDFSREILTVNDYDVCRKFEAAVIRAMLTQNVPCYNLNVSGAIVYTPEIKAKISQTHKGKIISDAHKQAIKDWNATKRQPITEKTRRKLSESKKGKKRGPLSEEWRRKISEAGKGLKRPEGFGAAITARQLGTKRGPLTEEQRETQRRVQTGRKHAPETISKLKAAKANISFETKKKMSEARKAYWAKKKENSNA